MKKLLFETSLLAVLLLVCAGCTSPASTGGASSGASSAAGTSSATLDESSQAASSSAQSTSSSTQATSSDEQAASSTAQPASSSVGAEGETAGNKLAIIHTNDVHGYIRAEEGVLGLAAVAQAKADYEAQGYEVLLLDAGDVLQGNLLANDTKGQAIVQFMNQAGYDVMALGNHDFDYGADVLEERMDAFEFPVLAANITVDATGELFAQDHAVFELDSGTKVGVFGIDTPATKSQSSPKNTVGLTFAEGEELYACAQDQIDQLREQGCHLVVCLGHLGEKGVGNRALDLIASTQGLDVLIDAHDHKVENERATDAGGKEVLLVETGCYLANIGVLTLEDGVWTETLLAAGEYTGSDSDLAAEIEAYATEIDQRMGEVVATTSVDLNGERAPGNRDRETNFGDLLADAMLWQATNAASKAPDAAIINGGGIRAGIPAGDIALRDIHNAQPFNNQLVTITVTGAQLLEALEAATQSMPDENGGFPQVAGITYTIDTTVPYEQGPVYPNTTVFAPANPGARVQIADVGGKGFNLEDTYIVAMADFLAMGGDTYACFAEAAQDSMEYIGYVDYQALQNYLTDELGGTVSANYAEPQGRITVIASEEEDSGSSDDANEDQTKLQQAA